MFLPCIPLGNDHLGYGESVVDDSYHGYFHHKDGNECLINDIHKLRCITSENYPDTTYFILGHSMTLCPAKMIRLEITERV